jgi:hypothetical protein
LLVDEMRDPSFSRTEGQRLAYRLERPCFVRREHAQGNTLCPCLCCREQDFDATHREGECSDPRALHEGATHDVVHGFLPRAVRATHLYATGLSSRRDDLSGQLEGRDGRRLFWNGSKSERRFCA